MKFSLACLVGASVISESGAADQKIFERRRRSAPPGVPQWNESVCPSFAELRSHNVVANFNAKRHIPGFYYELALHDVTQFPLCPSKPKCISSNKTVEYHPDGQEFVNDQWNLYCLGAYYPQVLLFNTTDEIGNLRGYVPTTLIPLLPESIVSSVVFPDTVVDFKGGDDGWVLEFQCVEQFGKVLFIGINFYSKVVSDQNYQEMYDAGMARGLGFYWEQGLGLTKVDHDGCPAPPTASTIV